MYNIQTVLCRVIFRDIDYPIYCVKMKKFYIETRRKGMPYTE